MTTMTNPRTPGSAVDPRQSLMTLARAEALRFARHPLFLVSAAVMLFATAFGVANQKVVDVGVEGTVLPAFFVGVFGFVVAHRLTTSLRRSGDLADTAPVSAQRRTLALCLACLVPMTLGILVVLSSVLFGAIWPPEPARRARRVVRLRAGPHHLGHPFRRRGPRLPRWTAVGGRRGPLGTVPRIRPARHGRACDWGEHLGLVALTLVCRVAVCALQ